MAINYNQSCKWSKREETICFANENNIQHYALKTGIVDGAVNSSLSCIRCNNIKVMYVKKILLV